MEASVLQQHWDPRERELLRSVDARLAAAAFELSKCGLTRELAQVALAREEMRELILGNQVEDNGHDSIVALAAQLRGRQMVGAA